MRGRPVLVSVVLVVALTLGWLPGGVRAADEGELVFQQNCQLCHTPERVRAKHMSREEWQQIVNKMIAFGCPIRGSKKNQGIVLAYLARTQGPVGGPAVAAAAAPGASPLGPAAPAQTGKVKVYVVNEDSNDVTVLDAATRAVLGRCRAAAHGSARPAQRLRRHGGSR